jgi:elongation factor 1-beta
LYQINPKDAPNADPAEEDDDDDLFGSDDESEDEEAKKVKEANLAAYKKKKEGKVKPAAKSLVTLDVKPWGTCYMQSGWADSVLTSLATQTMRPI